MRRSRRRLAGSREHPLPRAGVRVGALSVDREAAAVTEAAVAAEVHQALDVHLHFATKIALDLVVGLEELSDLLDVVLGQLLGLLGRRDLRTLADGPREGLAHA